MRLLYICSDYGIRPSGTKGASIHLRAITSALSEAGHDLRLLSPKGGPGNGHPARPLLPDEHNPIDDSIRTLKKWLEARELGVGPAREMRPLLYNAWVNERAIEALRESPVDAIVERLSLFGHVGVDLADELNLPLIVEVNAVLTEESRRYRGLHLDRLAESIESRVFDRADALMPVSAQLAQQLEDRGLPAEKIHVVPNGADVSRFSALPSRDECRADLGVNASFIVGFVGSLKVWHGADVLLEAFSRLLADDPRARLLIVGSGPQEAVLWNAARKGGIDEAVIFTGAVAHQRVPALIRAMDVAVAPYTPMEDFYFSPIKLFEYMAASVSVVASRIGQIEEVIEDGVTGLLCQPGDAQDLYRVMSSLRRSAELRDSLAQRALEVVNERFTWSHAGATTTNVITDAIDRRGTIRFHAGPVDRIAEAS